MKEGSILKYKKKQTDLSVFGNYFTTFAYVNFNFYVISKNKDHSDSLCSFR